MLLKGRTENSVRPFLIFICLFSGDKINSLQDTRDVDYKIIIVCKIFTFT